MSEVIPQRELRNHNARVIDAVAAGQTFVVTRNGEPVAELRPHAGGRTTFVPRERIAALAVGDVRVDPDRLRADLDALVDQEW